MNIRCFLSVLFLLSGAFAQQAFAQQANQSDADTGQCRHVGRIKHILADQHHQGIQTQEVAPREAPRVAQRQVRAEIGIHRGQQTGGNAQRVQADVGTSMQGAQPLREVIESVVTQEAGVVHTAGREVALLEPAVVGQRGWVVLDDRGADVRHKLEENELESAGQGRHRNELFRRLAPLGLVIH